MNRHFLDALPIWGIFILTIILGLVMVELGYRLGTHWKKRHPDEKNEDISGMIGATLGLWAFLLAFLVGIAVSRYDNRRGLVLQEVNAIGTTYLRAGYLPEPNSTETRALLREYTALRPLLAEKDTALDANTESEAIHPQLWALIEDLAASQPQNQQLAIYIQSLNEVIDLHTSRVVAGTVGRVPYTLYLVMYLVAVIAMFMLGFQSGINGKRDLFVTLALIVVFSGVMWLIVDLDRPWDGLLTVSQQPYLDLLKSLANFR